MKAVTESRSKLSRSSEVLDARQERFLIGFGIILLLGALGAVGALIYAYIELGYQDRQIVVLLASSVLYLFAILGVLLPRRNKRTARDVWILIIAMWVEMSVIGLTLSTTGQVLGLLLFILTIALGTFTLSQKSIGRVVLLGVIVRFMLEIGSQLFQAWQIALINFTNIETIEGAILLVVFGLLIFWRFTTYSLTNKLVLIFVFLTLVSTSVINFFNTATISSTLTDNIGQSLRSQAEAQSRLVGDMLQSEITALRAMATNPVLRNKIEQANWAYRGDETAIQEEIVLRDDEWRSAVQTGTITPFMTSRLENIASGKLEEFQLTSVDNLEVFVTDQYGAVVGTTNVTSDYAQADEVWWQSAYNNGWGAVYIGTPVYDDSARANVIQIAVPVSNPSTGRLIGVLRTSFSIDAFVSSVGKIQIGETGEVDIVFTGSVNMHFHEGELELLPSQEIGLLQLVKDIPYGQIAIEGVESLISRAPVSSTVEDLYIQSLGWYVIAHQHADEALAPVKRQQQINQLLTAIIMVVVSLGAISLAQVVTGPVSRLTDVANRIREGDLAAEARVESADEVGTLAGTFNQMTSQLRSTLVGLEQRVSERTRELTLSAEVSRTLSRVRDLNQLLSQAVELIQFSFELYYTQVYLVDPVGSALVLRAGTGDVGAELLQRQHRLAIGSGSINGLAASEQRPILVSDTSTSPIFRPNPLLPETRSELSVPLIVGDRVVGVLDMQSARPGALSEENLSAFESLAGQLAIAIENAESIAEAELARDELEQQARRLSAQGWVEYLDAIQRSERIGYAFDGKSLQSITEAQPESAVSKDSPPTVLSLPVAILGQPIGRISLEREAEMQWSQSDRDLVSSVADQMARQIENLRLLAQAEQYRMEAEEAARRLTREGWEGYLESTFRDKEYRFVYDHTRVKEIETEDVQVDKKDNEEENFVQLLQIRGVPVGELVLAGVTLSEEDHRMVEFIAERLGEHIENLRLASQTDLALASTEALYAGSEAIVRSNTVDDVLRAVVSASPLGQFSHARVMIFDTPWADRMPAGAEVAGIWERSDDKPEMSVGEVEPMSAGRLVTVLRRSEPFYVFDVETEENIDDERRKILAERGRSMAFFPLVTADQWIGWLETMADEPVNLTDAQLRQAQSLVGQASAVIQGIRLLQESEARARHEQMLRQMTERLRSAVDPEQVLRTAVKEVGQVLGRTVLIRLGNAQTGDQQNT